MYIQRDIESKLIKWKNNSHRQPLILQGARQIGKTSSIKKFGSDHYDHIAIFNFDIKSDLAEIFKKTKDVDMIIQELRYYTNAPLIPEKTLIFFDEIQECPEALNSLKYFDENAPQYHVIAAGSLLGVAINRNMSGFPVGKVHFEKMYPLSFREFLRCINPNLFVLTEEIVRKKERLPLAVYNKLVEIFKSYMICGGLPRVVTAFIEGEGMDAVEQILSDILNAYSADFIKYSDSRDIPRIHEIWRSVPAQLSRENRKFVFRTVREGARAREYENALNWLTLSGMIHKVYLTETPLMPLNFYEDTTAFKVYMADIALLRMLSGLPKEVILSPVEGFREFKGAMAENFVLNSLIAQGFESPHYWTLTKNKAEVDFLIPNKLDVIPVEVKAETTISGKSFAVYNEKYNPQLRIRLSMLNIKKDGNLLNLPLFLTDWIQSYL